MLLDQTTVTAASFLTASKALKGLDQVPVIPLTPLRRVKPNEFEPYLHSIGQVIDKYQLQKALGPTCLEGVPDLLDNQDKNINWDVSDVIPMKQTKSLDRLHRTRMLYSSSKQLSNVPEIFSDPNFDIGNPHIFSSIVEYKDVIGLNANDEESSFRELMDKLTLYGDHIEVKLLKEISNRSSSFFYALTNLQELEKETAECISKLETIRSRLKDISDINVKEGLEIIRLQQNRGNQSVLYQIVNIMEHAKDARPVIETLLQQSDFIGALDLIEETSLILKGIKDIQQAPQPIEISKGISIVSNDGEIPSHVDLKGMSSMVQLSKELQDIGLIVVKKVEEEFTQVVARDLKIHIDGIVNGNQNLNGTTFHSIKNILSEHYAFTSLPSTTEINPPELSLTQSDEALKNVLTPLVIGMLRMGHLNVALNSYKDLLFKQVKVTSKQYYPTAQDDSHSSLPKQEKKAAEEAELSKKLKTMTFDDFYGTVVRLFVFYLKVLQRVAVVNDIILRVIKEAEASGLVIGKTKLYHLEAPKVKSKQTIDDDDDDTSFGTGFEFQNNDSKSNVVDSPYAQVIQDSKNVLFAATDLTQTRSAKLIGIRAEQNSQLNPKDFYRLFNACWEFLIAGEQLCGKMCFGLKGSLLNQAKSFLTYFHEEKSKQIILLLEHEQWIQADIPIDFQHITEQLQSNSFSTSLMDPVIQKRGSKESLDEDEKAEMDIGMGVATAMSSTESISTNENPTSSKHLMVDGSKYYAVVSTLIFLKMITEYVQCANNIPAITPEVVNRIYELLKLFNSRTCQLILGSGAMRSAGLERITAKHIALTSQSLGLIIAVIPYIQKGLSVLLNPKQHMVLNDFIRIMGDYRNHQNELYMNLVNIMLARLAEHSSNLVAINWDTPEAKDFCSDGISVPMSVLVKETITLHKVTYRYLPPESLRSILNEIFRSYVRRLEDDFKKIELYSSQGKNRLLSDVHYLIENLGKLDGVDGPGSQLEVCVNNIKIRDKNSKKPTPPLPTTTPTKPAPPKSTFAYNFGNMLRKQND